MRWGALIIVGVVSAVFRKIQDWRDIIGLSDTFAYRDDRLALDAEKAYISPTYYLLRSVVLLSIYTPY